MVMQFKENNKPIFLQIADRIADDIVAGQQPEGSRMPSVREYASSVEVNINTVMRAYDHLASSGIIFNRRGIGYFVWQGAAQTIISSRRESFLNNEINDTFRQLKLLNISPDELRKMYESFLELTD